MYAKQKASDIFSVEIQAKADAARQYCQVVSEYNIQNGKSPGSTRLFRMTRFNATTLSHTFSLFPNNSIRLKVYL
jgi:hypothetical protein